MRQLASFLLVAIALPALAADAWRWKDDKGVVHYSDTPVPGAERIAMPDSVPGSNTGSTTQPVQPPPPEPAAFKYSECIVRAPGNDQTFNAVNQVTASLSLSPALLPDHRIQVILDELVYPAWPARSLAFTLKDIYRGTHTLAVRVVDAEDKPVCTGPAISFHVRQPSLLAPNRQPKKP